METDTIAVWKCEHTTEVNAAPEIIWKIFQAVSEWPTWNAGIERIVMEQPFAPGSHFEMTLPGGPTLTTRLVEVRENAGFMDETRVDDLRVLVDHQIHQLAPEKCLVRYALEAFGPSCDQVGPMIAADFPDVLKALAALAEKTAAGIPKYHTPAS